MRTIMKNMKTEEELKEICDKEGYDFIRVLNKEVGNKKRKVRFMEIVHRLCGRQYVVRVDSFTTRGQRCMCQRKKKYAKYQTIEDLQKVINERYGENEYIVQEPFISIRKPITLKHSCGYKYQTEASWLVYKRRTENSVVGLCPICSKRKHRTAYETEQKLKSYGYDFTILDENFDKGKRIINFVLVRNNKCGCEYKININDYITSPLTHSTCPKCQKWGVSSYEEKIKKEIQKFYAGEIISNYRIREGNTPYELDIYIPEKKLGIEIDGLYWHSTKFKSKNYHLEKTMVFAKHGIRVVHIFEDEVVDKFDIVIDKLHSMITKCDTQIYARKCKIVQPSPKQKTEFLNTNHIQGDSQTSNILYGLEYEGELVAVMTFSKHRGHGKKNSDNYYGDNVYDLTRYATKLGTNVIGGFTKLLEHFKKNYDYDKIVSYGDIRYTDLTKNVYANMGFKEDHRTYPSYYYVRNLERLSKYNFRKSELQKLTDFIYDPGMTEQENMEYNGFDIIYDCGLMAYVMEK